MSNVPFDLGGREGFDVGQDADSDGSGRHAASKERCVDYFFAGGLRWRHVAAAIVAAGGGGVGECGGGSGGWEVGAGCGSGGRGRFGCGSVATVVAVGCLGLVREGGRGARAVFFVRSNGRAAFSFASTGLFLVTV